MVPAGTPLEAGAGVAVLHSEKVSEELLLIYTQTRTSSGNQRTPFPRLGVTLVISVLLLHRNRSKDLRETGHKLLNESSSSYFLTWQMLRLGCLLILELQDTPGLGPGLGAGSGLRCWGYLRRPKFLSLPTPFLLHSSPHQPQFPRITDFRGSKVHANLNT